MVTGLPLRILFFGSPTFAVPSLDRLIASPHPVVGVVTQPDRPRGRGQRVSPGPVKIAALAHGLRVLQPDRLARDPVGREIAQAGADLGVVVAYGKILPDWLLQIPPHGLINVHASLLPCWRGAAPIHRAVMAGDAETGVTIMRVVTALDAGPTLASARRSIGRDETADVVEADLARMGADLLVEVVDRIARGDVVETPQDDALATYAPRLTREEGILDWTRPAAALHNQIRGLRPWPGTWTHLGRERIIVRRSRLPGEPASDPPGAVVAILADSVRVACGDGRALDLLDLQTGGRRALPACEFAAAHSLAGRRFG